MPVTVNLQLAFVGTRPTEERTRPNYAGEGEGSHNRNYTFDSLLPPG
ncbi:MAG: hypothetical protein ACK526_06705 [Planctomyces sp.]